MEKYKFCIEDVVNSKGDVNWDNFVRLECLLEARSIEFNYSKLLSDLELREILIPADKGNIKGTYFLGNSSYRGVLIKLKNYRFAKKEDIESYVKFKKSLFQDSDKIIVFKIEEIV